MARTPEDILKEILGSQTLQLVMIQSKVENLQEELEKLKKKNDND